MPFMRLLFGIHLSLRTIVCTTLVWAYVGSMIAKGDLARGVVYHDKIATDNAIKESLVLRALVFPIRLIYVRQMGKVNGNYPPMMILLFL